MELLQQIEDFHIPELDAIRLGRPYEVIVGGDEHDGLENWVRNGSDEVGRRLDARERHVA